MSEIKVMLDDGAFMPERAHDLDAGYDLRTPVDVIVPPCSCYETIDIHTNRQGRDVYVGSAMIDTGVHIELPKGTVGFLKSKSGLNVKYGLLSEGVIDAGYTGSIVVKLYNHTGSAYEFKRGDKITQLVILPIETPDLIRTDSLSETERGTDGFGSTGRA